MKIVVVMHIDLNYQGKDYQKGRAYALPSALAMHFLKMGWAYETKMMRPGRRKQWHS